MDDHQGAIPYCTWKHYASIAVLTTNRVQDIYYNTEVQWIASYVYVFLNFVGAYSHYPCHLMAPIVIMVNASIHFIDPVYELITADGALVKFLQHTLWT